MLAAIQPLTLGQEPLPCTIEELQKIEGRVPNDYLIKFGIPGALLDHRSQNSVVLGDWSWVPECSKRQVALHHLYRLAVVVLGQRMTGNTRVSIRTEASGNNKYVIFMIGSGLLLIIIYAYKYHQWMCYLNDSLVRWRPS
jgi:hypothetical protein